MASHQPSVESDLTAAVALEGGNELILPLEAEVGNLSTRTRLVLVTDDHCNILLSHQGI